MYELIESRWGNDYHVSIDTIGMDYDSAVEAMPRWYGVSFGNGNDGVSHAWPNFYVRTCEPFVLVAAALLSDFTPGEGITWAFANMEVDGEADYTVSATIFDPPDDRDDYGRELEAAQEAETDAENALADLAGSDDDNAREQAEQELAEATQARETLEENDPGYWSEANGAWMICEVFPVDEPDTRKPIYNGLSETFSAEIIELAREA